MGNILFDEKNNRFWLIDFSNSYEHYYSIDKDSKLFVNEMADREFCSILKTLRENAIYRKMILLALFTDILAAHFN